MRWLLFVLLLLASIFAGCSGGAGGEKAVDYRVCDGYYAGGNSDPARRDSYLATASRERYEAMFGHATFETGDTDRKFGYGDGEVVSLPPLTRDAFTSRLVLAVIKRGVERWEYQVRGVTVSGDRLAVRYATLRHEGNGAESASPLVVSVPKGNYRSVTFIENGVEAGVAYVDDSGP